MLQLPRKTRFSPLFRPSAAPLRRKFSQIFGIQAPKSNFRRLKKDDSQCNF